MTLSAAQWCPTRVWQCRCPASSTANALAGRAGDRTPGSGCLGSPFQSESSLLHISFGTKASRPRDVLVALRNAAGGAWVENLLVILVVEDDQLVQSVVEESLTDGGFETVIASSGENAVELLDASDGKYRALVTDINLGRGGIDGWSVARHAREIDPNFPVIYMSGKDADEWTSKGLTKNMLA